MNLKYVIEGFIADVTVQSHSDMCGITNIAIKTLQSVNQVSVFHTQTLALKK